MLECNNEVLTSTSSENSIFSNVFQPDETSKSSQDENLSLILKLLLQEYLATNREDGNYRHYRETRDKLAQWLKKIHRSYPESPIVNYVMARLYLYCREPQKAHQCVVKAFSLHVHPALTYTIGQELIFSATSDVMKDKFIPIYVDLLIQSLLNGGTNAGLMLEQVYKKRQFIDRLYVLSKTMTTAYILGNEGDFKQARVRLAETIYRSGVSFNPAYRLEFVCRRYGVGLARPLEEAVRLIQLEPICIGKKYNMVLFNCFRHQSDQKTLKKIEQVLIEQQSLTEVTLLWEENRFDTNNVNCIKDRLSEYHKFHKLYKCMRITNDFEAITVFRNSLGYLDVLISDDFEAITAFRKEPWLYFFSDSAEFDTLIERNNLLALVLSLTKYPNHRAKEYRKKVASGVRIKRLMHYFVLANKRDDQGDRVNNEVNYLFEMLVQPDVLEMMPSSMHTAVKTYYYLTVLPESCQTELRSLMLMYPKQFRDCTEPLKELRALTDPQLSLVQGDAVTRRKHSCSF